MAEFYVEIGHTVSFTKTVSEQDVYAFAEVTGDLSPNHVDKAYVEQSSYGKLMVHGALTLAILESADKKIPVRLSSGHRSEQIYTRGLIVRDANRVPVDTWS
jgi:hypothetical protein